MINTPRTDYAIRGREIEGFGRIEWIEVDFARQLERENLKLRTENAALRNKLVEFDGKTNWVCKCGGTDCEGQRENAALRAALDRLSYLARDMRQNRSTLRAAIDAARKEAKP